MPNATTIPSSLHLTPLQRRGILMVSGEDRCAFLQGLISNDIRHATKGHALYAAYLTPQGKFLYDFFVLAMENALLLDVEATAIPDLIAKLTAHKLRSKVTLSDACAQWSLWAVWGNDIPESRTNLFRDNRHPTAGWRYLLPAGHNPDFGTITPYASYNYHRLMLGIPDTALDMDKGKSTLLEGNFDRINGISWDKGCYLGQELTARTKYRGHVKRRLMTVRLSGTPETDSITQNNQEIGFLRSREGDLGLALLNVSATADHTTPITAGTCRLTLVSPSEGEASCP